MSDFESGSLYRIVSTCYIIHLYKFIVIVHESIILNDGRMFLFILNMQDFIQNTRQCMDDNKM